MPRRGPPRFPVYREQRQRHPVVFAFAVAMEHRGLSHRVLARRAGMTRQMVNEIFNGDRSPTLEMLDALAHQIGLELRIDLVGASNGAELLTIQYAKVPAQPRHPAAEAAPWKTTSRH